MLRRHGRGFPFLVLATCILPVSKSEQTHSRLQQRALDLFSEHGFEATTVERMAEPRGVVGFEVILDAPIRRVR